MKIIYRVLTVFLIAILLTSCSKEEAKKYLDSIFQTDLTDSEVAEGLKAALKVGTDTASGQLSVQDGYYKDLAVKILLPEEINSAINSFKSKEITLVSALNIKVTGEQLYNGYSNYGINITGLKSKEDDLILGINRAAEAAAKEAAPVFIDAITDMTILDAKNILFTEDTTAATTYLIGKTSQKLFDNYEPKIDAALNSVKINNTSVVNVYEDYINQYNSILNTSIGTTTIGAQMNLNPIAASDLSAYSTQKGLDGIYLKVSEEEGAIRRDPLARVTDVLEKVFSELDNRTE